MKKVFEKKVIAIIVTYNRKKLLKECINAILSQNYKNCIPLIIDNASTDNTFEYIKEYINSKKVVYKNTGSNLGGAGGFNYGMKEAYKLGCDYMWVMDDDCIPHSDSLSELIKADEKLNGDYGFLSSKVLWKDNSICIMNRQKKSFSRWLKNFDTNYQKIAMCSFVSFFIKSETVKKYGLPIKEFFIWTDDWEYSRRISQHEKCYFISSSVVTHKCKENIGANIASVDGDRLERFKYLYKNDCVLYRMEGIKGYLLLKIRILLHKYKILISNKKDKKQRLSIIDNALKIGRSFYPKIEYVDDLKAKKIKIVEFFGEPISYGGQESFILNVYSKMDKSKFEFTFITPFECNNEKIKKIVKENKDYLISDKQKFETKLRKINILKTAKRYLNNEFDIVHIHSGSIFTLYNVAKISKKAGVKKVIVHSHLAGQNNLKYKLIKFFSDRNICKYADYFFACSKLAGNWKFPESVIKSDKYFVIKNGVDIEKFKFNAKNRNEYRKKFKMENMNVLIHVGRFSHEKNQLYILDIFKELKRQNNNVKLLLVGGTGDLLEKVKNKIEKEKMTSDVYVLVNRDDVEKLINMSDVFILPSLWEGLPFTGIEAQTNGLPCIFSENITDEINISGSFNKLPIDVAPSVWASKISELFHQDRIDTIKDIQKNGYDIQEVCDFLTKIYGDSYE